MKTKQFLASRILALATIAAGLLTSPCVSAQTPAANPFRAVSGPQADAEMAVMQAKKLTEIKLYSQKALAVYQGNIAILAEVRNAEKAKPEIDQKKDLIESTTTEEQFITANWLQTQLRIAVLEADCIIPREQITNQQAIFTALNSLLDLYKKSGVDVEVIIPLYNQVTENVTQASEIYQKSDAKLKTILANMEEDKAANQAKYGRK
jgi:hypothetical protein